jgi:hypothetical protein
LGLEELGLGLGLQELGPRLGLQEPNLGLIVPLSWARPLAA